MVNLTKYKIMLELCRILKRGKITFRKMVLLMKLTKREKEVLNDILKTEIIEVEDMIKDDEDKNELLSYLDVVKSIFSKCEGDTVCMG